MKALGRLSLAIRQPFQQLSAATKYSTITRPTRQLTMATPHHIQIDPGNTGLLKYPQTEESAARVSELLQLDLQVRKRPTTWMDIACIAVLACQPCG
jgi:hypothetical protein